MVMSAAARQAAAAVTETLIETVPDGAALVCNPTHWTDVPDTATPEFMIGWFAAQAMIIAASTTALTANEEAIIAKVADIAEDFIDLCGDGPTATHDWAEILPHLHALQQAVMAQAAARTYPTKYRPLGGTRDE